ncbi:hypothetical protein GGR56DRAFT_652504, partial [Xylariaceae sp. FL0804]
MVPQLPYRTSHGKQTLRPPARQHRPEPGRVFRNDGMEGSGNRASGRRHPPASALEGLYQPRTGSQCRRRRGLYRESILSLPLSLLLLLLLLLLRLVLLLLLRHYCALRYYLPSLGGPHRTSRVTGSCPPWLVWQHAAVVLAKPEANSQSAKLPTSPAVRCRGRYSLP